MKNPSIHSSVDAANAAAAEVLAAWLTAPGARTVMVAGGNTALELSRRVAEQWGEAAAGTVPVHDSYRCPGGSFCKFDFERRNVGPATPWWRQIL